MSLVLASRLLENSRSSLARRSIVGPTIILALVGCGSGDSATSTSSIPATGGAGGAGGMNGEGGTAGDATAGTSGGNGTSGAAGHGGTSGGSGTSGTSGASAGAGTAGSAASSGSAGASGTAGIEGSSGAAGSGGTATAQPIAAPSEQWTWVPVDGAVCANGSATGFGVNLTDQSDDLVIVLEGGGACWDAATCWSVGTSFNVSTGYGATEFSLDPQVAQWMFSRIDSTNPWTKASFAYVPYCTGDVHAGTRVVDYDVVGQGIKTTHHVGASNLALYLARLKATLPTTTRVWLVGSSAGGYGAAVNWNQTQDAFPEARVDVIDDSGPPVLSNDLFHVWRDAWGMSFPADCTDCADSIGNLITYDAQRFQGSRFALISYTADAVIPEFLGMNAIDFAQALDTFAGVMDGYTGFKYFYVPFTGHTLLLGATEPVQLSDGVFLGDWVEQMKTDDTSWKSHKP